MENYQFTRVVREGSDRIRNGLQAVGKKVENGKETKRQGRGGKTKKEKKT